MADRIIVGRFVGDTAFPAIGATNAMSMMFMSMCMGAAIGTGVVVSQYFGAGNKKGTAVFALFRYKHGAWKTKKLV